MQPAAGFTISGSNSAQPMMAMASTQKSAVQDSNRQPDLCNQRCYHSTGICSDTTPLPHCLNLSGQKFLTPAPIAAPTPQPPCFVCPPKFRPPQSEAAGRGLVPLGDQEKGEQTFCCPHPPPTEMGPDRKEAQHPPPPSMPSHPHCRPSHGDRGPSGSGRRATSMMGSGTRMVTQQVVLLSHTSEQVDPSTTLLPPPRPAPPTEGCTESATHGGQTATSRPLPPPPLPQRRGRSGVVPSGPPRLRGL